MFFREWFAVLCTACFVAAVFLTRAFPSRPLISMDPPPPETIQVEVQGAVEKPGVYEVKVGSSVHSVMAQAVLTKAADRKALYLKKKLLSSCSLTVPEKKDRKSKKKNQHSRTIARESCANEGS